jgi:hypothetical protein
MAFAISETQTVLWDQFEYNGDPKDFSWVLPVRPGAYVELAEDAWLTALDRFTSTTVLPPPLSCAQGDGGGCSCGGRSDASSSAPASAGGGFASPGDVTVVRRERVGPYDSVVLRSQEPDALRGWLTEHGYVIPREIEPVIDAYVREGNDFLALRLAPAVGVNQMEPVRVITPGGDYLLPLRMVAAGVGSFVAIKLFVIAEGRYTMPDMAEVSILERDLSYDFARSLSNYAEVRDAALAQNSGKTALVPFARKRPFDTPNISPAPPNLPTGFSVQNPRAPSAAATTLSTLYVNQAAADDGIFPPSCSPPLGATGLVRGACPSGEACPPLAASEVAAEAFVCGAYTDLAVAITGMRPDRVWLTRFEMNLPSTALDADCVVEPAVADVEVAPFQQAKKAKNPPCDPPLFSAGFGGTLLLLTSLGTLFARRRAGHGAAR